MSVLDTFRTRYERLKTGAGGLAARIQTGDAIIVSNGSMQPYSFLAALSNRHDLKRVVVYSANTIVPPDFLVRQFVTAGTGDVPNRNVLFRSFAVGPGTRQGAVAGVVDVIPVASQHIGSLVSQQRIDVLVVGSSGMDDDGNFNLSCNVDWMPDLLAAAEQADTLVVVEVNEELPRTEGETTFRLETVDHIIESRRAPVDLPPGAPLPQSSAVGGFLATLVPNEATLHLGVGDLVSQAVAFLESKRDLGVHSDLICDVMLRLHERGALTGRKKGFMKGKLVGSYALGTRQLYGWLHQNDSVNLYPTEFVVQPATILRNNRVVSITQAARVDLVGQVAGQTMAREFTTNPGIQHRFHWAAGASPGGRGIVVLPSSSRAGKMSNIVTALEFGANVSIPATDVDCVVTEHGVARLRGRSVSERVSNMIAIAHPGQRDPLAFEARRLGIL